MYSSELSFIHYTPTILFPCNNIDIFRLYRYIISYKNVSRKQKGGITMNITTDVLIIGAGPSGSVLALDLIRRGVKVRIIDKAQSNFTGSRAKGIQPRSQELLADLGLIEAVQKKGMNYPKMGIHIGPFTIPFRMHPAPKPSEDVPYPSILLLPQYDMNRILHDEIMRLGGIVEYNTLFVSLQQYEQYISSTLSTGEIVHSHYVVGADGGASIVRKMADISFIGETDEADRMLIIDGTIQQLKQKYWHVWPHVQGRQVAVCPLPDKNRFQIMIRLKPRDTIQLTDTALHDLFYTLTGQQLTMITWKSVFRPNIRLATYYRKQRIFLIGDAAHVHTPAGAQGLNTGMQDAYNLGWKLEQVLRGAKEKLLDTYEQERRPIAANVLKLSDSLYSKINSKKITGLKRGTEENQLSVTYANGPLAKQIMHRKINIGDRAPDAQLGSQPSKKLFDLTKGPHFTLLAIGPEAIDAMNDFTWPQNSTPLKKYAIKNDTSFKKIYGIDSPTCILIRPDGYIGGIITNNWLAEWQHYLSVFTNFQN